MSYLPHHREIKECNRQSNAIATAFYLFCLISVIGMMCWSCVDGIVKTVENEEQESRRRIYASETYVRPAAWRLASPTSEQMDHLHHVRQVAEVAK